MLPEKIPHCAHCGAALEITPVLRSFSANDQAFDVHSIELRCTCGSPAMRRVPDIYSAAKEKIIALYMASGFPVKKDRLDAFPTPTPPINFDTSTFPSSCPVCQSDNVDYGSIDIDDAIASQSGHCEDCEARWTEHYRISSRVITKKKR